MDGSTQPVDVRSNVAASILLSTPSAIPRVKASLADGRGTAAAASYICAAMEKVLSEEVLCLRSLW